MSDDPTFQPGFQPLVIVNDKDAAAEFEGKMRAGGLTINDAFALRRKAYRYHTNDAGYVQMRKPNGMTVNSLLRKDEWEELDRAVLEAVSSELNGVQALRNMGLVQRLGGLGSMVSQWNVASERTAASLTMSGRSNGERGRVEKRLRSVPVPIAFAEYEIGLRELEASRRLGDALDTTEAAASARVVAEKQEELLFSGDTTIVVGGDNIEGFTTATGRDTDTATNYGGGDFATAGNGAKTILGMISALAAKNYRGPFGVWISNTQYWQVQTPLANRDGNDLSDILAIPQVSFADRSDELADGVVIVAQLTRDVVDLAVALEVTNREWASGDEMAFYGKVMAAVIPRVKTDYAGNVGVAHATAA
jgi:uncharacterized linocin/CFP29 family protein